MKYKTYKINTMIGQFWSGRLLHKASAVLCAGIFLILAFINGNSTVNAYSSSALGAYQLNMPAQQQIPQDANTETVLPLSGNTNLETTRLEQQYDSYLRTILSPYFDGSSYFVHTRITLRMVDSERRERSTDSASFEVIEQQLPGLAATPDFLRIAGRQPDSQRERTIVEQLPELQEIRIELTIDNSYSTQDEELIAYLVASAAKLVPERGDSIELFKRNFPAYDPAGRDFSTQPAAADAGSANADEGEQNEGIFAGLDAFPAALIAAIVLALIVLLVLFIIVRKYVKNNRIKKASAGLNNRNRTDTEPIKDPLSRNNEQKERVAGAAAAGHETVPAPNVQEPEDELLGYFMRHTSDMSRLIDGWINVHDHNGLLKSSRLLQITDPKLLNRVERYMLPSNWARLNMYINEKDKRSRSVISDDDKSLMNDTLNELKRRTRPGSLFFRLRTLRDFDFLDFAKIQVLVDALKDRDSFIIALVAAHLSNEKADAFISALPPHNIPGVWSSMAEIDDIFQDEYAVYAREVFKTIISIEKEQKSTDYTDAEMVELIARRLESQPLDIQNTMYKQFRTDFTPLSAAVTEYVITMQNLHKQPDEILVNACDLLDSEQTAYALYGQDEKFISTMLQNRNNREQQLIRSVLKTAETLDKEQTQKAMELFLTNIRRLKRGKETVLI